MERYFIIADDFTGSNDTGVQLSRRGVRTKVVLDPASVLDDGLSYVLDTESRNMREHEAGEKVAGLLKDLDLQAFDCVIKKVDSTLRGNIADEVLETDRKFGSELILFMPALPGLGRTTVNSIHLLNGVRIGETELAKDPRKPVRLDNIAEILRSVYTEPVGVLPLEMIRSGAISFEGKRLWACDAVTDQDMRAVVAAGKGTGKRILWIGTAAIADRILEALHPSYPSLAVITSVSDVTRKQLHFARDKGLAILQVDIPALLRGEPVAPYVELAVSTLLEGKDLALVSSASFAREELAASTSAGAACGMSGEDVAEFACTAVTRLAAQILDRAPVSGLYMCGGDTAIHFFREVGAGGSEITSELTVGIPEMILTGGRFDGLKVITKAGAFGTEDVMPMIMRKLGEASAI